MLDVNNRRGKWINTLHDFSFKMIHKARSKHTNVDALNRNMVDVVEEEDEIQDCKLLQLNRNLMKLFGHVYGVQEWEGYCNIWEVTAY